MEFFCGISVNKNFVSESKKQTKTNKMSENIVCGIKNSNSDDDVTDNVMDVSDEQNTQSSAARALKSTTLIAANQADSISGDVNTNTDTPRQWPRFKIRPMAAEMPTPVTQLSLPYRRQQQQQQRSMPLIDDYDDNSNNERDVNGCLLPKCRRIESRAATSAAVAAIERSLGMQIGYQPWPKQTRIDLATEMFAPHDGNKYDVVQWPLAPPSSPSRSRSPPIASPPPTLPPRTPNKKNGTLLKATKKISYFGGFHPRTSDQQ